MKTQTEKVQINKNFSFYRNANGYICDLDYAIGSLKFHMYDCGDNEYWFLDCVVGGLNSRVHTILLHAEISTFRKFFEWVYDSTIKSQSPSATWTHSNTCDDVKSEYEVYYESMSDDDKSEDLDNLFFNGSSGIILSAYKKEWRKFAKAMLKHLNSYDEVITANEAYQLDKYKAGDAIIHIDGLDSKKIGIIEP